jgi:hypothetical protein
MKIVIRNSESVFDFQDFEFLPVVNGKKNNHCMSLYIRNYYYSILLYFFCPKSIVKIKDG